jgi:hypothetical protein
LTEAKNPRTESFYYTLELKKKKTFNMFLELKKQ